MSHPPVPGVMIDGAWVRGASIDTVLDKYSLERHAEVANADAAQVTAAVDAATRAARNPLPGHERAAILRRAADVLRDRKARIVADYIAETGFTVADGDSEFERMIATLLISAEEATRIAGEEVPLRDHPAAQDRIAFTVRVPVGIVAAIAPFNAPLNTVMHKVGPALAAGNAVVLKPARATPLSSIAIADALVAAGLPGGFMNVVCGSGAEVGESLLADGRIRFYTFTGSTNVGLRVKQASGIAKTHLELGANSATLVAADADLDAVVAAVTRAGFRKAGQVCTSVQRLLVDASVADALWDRLSLAVDGLVSGDPRRPETQVGPVIAVREAQRASSWIRDAAGRSSVGGDIDRAVVRPAAVLAPRAGSRLLEDEIFAPVVAVVPVASMDEAVSIVNAGRFGLQAGVFTQDVDRAFDLANRLHMGGVMVNDTSSYHADPMPYGGVKDSGYGIEGPAYAVRDMTDPKIIVFRIRRPENTP
jgi:succinate-semialdehyde dehydrogenase/glutarate-semialdehyde dehydrogenase